MEQWLGDQYDIQGMGSLSGRISKRIGTCNIGLGGRGWAVEARQAPNNFENGFFPPLPPMASTKLSQRTV